MPGRVILWDTECYTIIINAFIMCSLRLPSWFDQTHVLKEGAGRAIEFQKSLEERRTPVICLDLG